MDPDNSYMEHTILSRRAGRDHRICRSRPQQTTGEGIVDRKVDLMAKELRPYGVSVAAIQEAKWFGSDVWEAQGYLFLHSGRPLPKEKEVAAKNEGGGIALNERATKAWKEAGEVWRAVSSRIVAARLKVSSTWAEEARWIQRNKEHLHHSHISLCSNSQSTPNSYTEVHG